MKIRIAKIMLGKAVRLSKSKNVDDLYFAQAICERIEFFMQTLVPTEVLAVKLIINKNLPPAWERFWKGDR